MRSGSAPPLASALPGPPFPLLLVPSRDSSDPWRPLEATLARPLAPAARAEQPEPRGAPGRGSERGARRRQGAEATAHLSHAECDVRRGGRAPGQRGGQGVHAPLGGQVTPPGHRHSWPSSSPGPWPVSREGGRSLRTREGLCGRRGQLGRHLSPASHTAGLRRRLQLQHRIPGHEIPLTKHTGDTQPRAGLCPGGSPESRGAGATDPACRSSLPISLLAVEPRPGVEGRVSGPKPASAPTLPSRAPNSSSIVAWGSRTASLPAQWVGREGQSDQGGHSELLLFFTPTTLWSRGCSLRQS